MTPGEHEKLTVVFSAESARQMMEIIASDPAAAAHIQAVLDAIANDPAAFEGDHVFCGEPVIDGPRPFCVRAPLHEGACSAEWED